VRAHVQAILEKVGAQLAEAIVYPAVAGAAENPGSREHAALLGALRAARPGLVEDVSRALSEFSRLAILPEDHISTALQADAPDRPRASNRSALGRTRRARVRNTHQDRCPRCLVLLRRKSATR
jgi:hypothetical protein